MQRDDVAALAVELKQLLRPTAWTPDDDAKLEELLATRIGAALQRLDDENGRLWQALSDIKLDNRGCCRRV